MTPTIYKNKVNKTDPGIKTVHNRSCHNSSYRIKADVPFAD